MGQAVGADEAVEDVLNLSSRGLKELVVSEELAGHIKSLDASRNHFTSLQASGTQHLGSSLQQLSLSRNKLQDVSGLALLANLRVLNLSRNHVLDIQPLQGLTKLEELDIHSNRISSLAAISTLPCLHCLNAAANQLTQLPSLAGLTRLTELNLRHNLISHLSAAPPSGPPPTAGATAGAAAGAAGYAAAGAAARPVAGAVTSAGNSSGLLPISLRRLSLACNHLQDAASLAVLRHLPSLVDLCVDGNPFTAASRNAHLAAAAAAAAAGSPGSSWYREAVLLAACTPSLLRLDGQAVSPAERALLLTSAAALHTPNRTQQLQDLSTALTATHISRLPAGTPGTDAAGRAAWTVHEPDPGAVEEQNYTQLDSTVDGTPAPAAEAVGDAVSVTEQQAVAAVVAKAIAAALAVEGPEAAPDAPNNPSLPSTSSCSAEGRFGEHEREHHHNQQQQDDEQGRSPGPQEMQQLSQEQAAVRCSTDSTHGLSSTQQQQQQQQQGAHQGGKLLYQGSLKAAAIACGIDAECAEFKPAGTTISSSSSSPTAVKHTAAPLAGAATATTAAAAAAAGRRSCDGDDLGEGLPGVFLSDAEVEEYLLVEKARLLTRTKTGPPPPSPPATTPGMELVGCRCVLTGSVLHLLKGEGLAAVTDLTLAHVAYAEVLDALPLLLALRRLRHLSLINNSGLNTLPQLHPLLQLRRLSHLTLQDCPICSLVLLRPYVAFRFTALQSFNGAAFSAEEIAAAGRLLGVMEGALDAALDEAPQHAALAAAGIRPSSSTTSNSGSNGGSNSSSGSNHCGAASSSRSIWLSPAAAAAAVLASGIARGQDPGSSSSRVSQVLAAMKGPLLPSAAVVAQSRRFARQVLSDAALVQQQLADFEDQTWPAILETSIQEAWQGTPPVSAVLK